MNLYNMTEQTKCCHVKFACTIGYHTLVVYYHAHCSIAYLACCADMGGIVISSNSEVKKCYTVYGRGWEMGRKEKWGDQKGREKGNKKR